MPSRDAYTSSSSSGSRSSRESSDAREHTRVRFRQVVRFRQKQVVRFLDAAAAEGEQEEEAPQQAERPLSPARQAHSASPEIVDVRSASAEPEAGGGNRLADHMAALELSRAERHTLRAERLRQQAAAKAQAEWARMEEQQMRLLEQRRLRAERARRDRIRLLEEVREVPPPNAVVLVPDDEVDVKPRPEQLQMQLHQPRDETIERCHGRCRERPTRLNDGEWEVDQVVDHMVQHGRLFFAVKWVGYPLGHCGAFDLWNPVENMHCPHLIQLYFHSRGIAPDRMPYQEQWNF